jgi:archaemetzincin
MIGFVRTFFLVFVIASCTPSLSSKSDLIIVPIDDVPEALLDSVQRFLAEAYQISPQVITPIALPENAFVNVKSPRYRADSLLVYLKKIRRAEEADFAFGLTAEDISTTKRDANGDIKKPEYKYADWGIMGLAYRPGREAVVSSFRLNPEHPLFYQRLKKVSIHEFGHNLGLPHCPDKRCVMTDAAESIKTIDACSEKLCPKCNKSVF